MQINSSRQIKSGALISYTTIVFNIIAGLIYTPWMVRQIGKSDYGLYVLVTSFLAYFIMDFGFGQAIARFIAKYRAEGNESKVGELLGLTTKLYLTLDLIFLFVLFLAFFFVGNIFSGLTPIEVSRFKVVYCIAGLFSLLSFPFTQLDGVLIAYERFVLLKMCDLFSKAGVVILMVIAISMGYGLYALIAIHALIGMAIITIKISYLKRASLIKPKYGNTNLKLLKELASFSFWITVFRVGQLFLINVTPLILGILSGTEQVAIFSIGMIIYGYTWTLANALNGLFLPKVAEFVENKRGKEEISKLLIRVGRIQLFVVGIVIIGIVSMGKQFIDIWMGKDFQNSYYVALLLTLPGIVIMTQEIGITYLLVNNELRYSSLMYVATSAISVLISVVLAPKLGAIGSSIGIFTALTLGQIFGMNYIYWKKMKLDIRAFFEECHIKMLLPICLSCVTGFILSKYIPAHNLLSFLAKASLLGLVYVLTMWTMGLNTEEKGLILSIIKKMKLCFTII